VVQPFFDGSGTLFTKTSIKPRCVMFENAANERQEKQSGFGKASSHNLVDMTNPREMRAIFGNRHAQKHEDGMHNVSMTDPFGGNSDWSQPGPRHSQSQQADRSSQAGQGMQPEQTGGKNGDGSRNQSSSNNLWQKLETDVQKLTTLTDDIAQLEGELGISNPSGAGSEGSSSGMSSEGSPSGAGSEGSSSGVGSESASSGTGTSNGCSDGAGSESGSSSNGAGNPSESSSSTGSSESSQPSGATTTGEGGTTSSSSGTSNPTSASIIRNQEQSDPTLSTTLAAASKAMSAQGFGQLENYLATNNANANPNLDATLMSSALSNAGLSTTDATALQKTEIANMQAAQVLTYAGQNDPALYKTLTDAAPQLSTQGWGQVENYLTNNYTGDQYMDSTLMNNVLNQAGLGASDQSALTNVLQNDLPSALAADPFAAGLQATDPTMSQTLTDASNAMSQTGYQQLETYVEDNYTGQTSSDGTILNSALSQAGLTTSDSNALASVLQKDMSGADSGGTSNASGSDAGAGVSSSPSGNGDSSTTASSGNGDSSTTASSGSGDSSTTASSGNGDSSTTASSGNGDSSTTASSGDGDSSTTGNGATDSTTSGGNPTSTTTFEQGGSTLLVPPQTSSGLVTPEGSLSGDNTAYQGTISGTTTGANDVKPSSATTGQGNGPDALHLSVESVVTTMDTKTGQGFQQKYGYFEADMKLSQANGKVSPNLWPGLFLESSAHELNPNGAASSEIDFMEAQTSNSDGHGDTAYNAGVHRNSSDYGNGSVPDKDQGPYTTNLPSLSSGYNVYGVNWQPNDKNIEFYFDGKEVGYNPVYDTTDNSPMYMIMDVGNGGWNSTDPSAHGGSMDVAWARVYQNANLVNSANDPDGTAGTTITDTNPNDSPPALSNLSDGGGNTPVKWVNTYNADFTQTSDYTTNRADTTAVLPGAAITQPVLTSNIISTESTGAQDTPLYEATWMVDQGDATLSGQSAGMSTAPGVNG
jgi:Glycosyl hydrolases family 16